MRHKTHHPVSARQRRDGLYYLYYPRGWIIIALLIFSAMTIAQEQTPPGGEFIIGSPLTGIPDRRTNEIYYNSFGQTGLNTVWQYAARGANSNQGYLQDYNLIAHNHDPLDWIGYYSTCYYTRWEAEQNQTDLSRVGVKNNGGEKVYWDSAWCWSTSNIISPTQSFIYGPHYRQDNRYKSWPHGDRHDVRYYPRFRMGLENQRNAEPEVEVCRIKVVYSYRKCVSKNDCGDSVAVFREKILTVGDFQPYGQLDYFTFNYPNDYYKYPPQFHLPQYAGKMDPTYVENYPIYEDSYSYQGIQFVIDWLVGDPQESGLILYVDHIEVFDRDWWEYLNPLTQNDVIDKIQNYAANYSNWSNLRYWYGHDEPYSIDAFTPIRIVDSILAEVSAPRLTTAFNPYWTWDDSKINGDTLLSQYVRMANPEKLWIDFYPFSPHYPFRFDDAEALRFRFQLCHTLRQDFWYMAQTFGEFYKDGDNWIPWINRYPEEEEVNASVMLALAHGSKGIFYWIYDSWSYPGSIYNLEHAWYYQKGLVDTIDINQQLNPTPLWYYLKDDLIPRLKGKLGSTLMKLDYTGNFLQYQYEDPQYPLGPTELDYLTLDECIPSTQVRNWHCGFFTYPSQIDNEYFLLANLITTDNRCIKLTVRAPENTQLINYRFRNIEGIFDTTFNAPNSLTKNIEYLPGEGYLYQVAPVIKYGGRLLYSEATTNGMILYDDMVIESGAVLTVNGVYSSKGNITVKSGGIINGGNGKIQFAEGKKLIIEGSGSITGASNSKLHLVFTPSQNDDPTGIEIKAGGSLSISNCKIENASVGINSLINANYLYAQNVDFINCEDYAISILGQSSGMNPTPPPRKFLTA